jgi:ribonuclease BN (tRNA processing enzyme)
LALYKFCEQGSESYKKPIKEADGLESKISDLDAKAMKIVFQGTNGWYDTHTGNTLCLLIESKKAFIILDAGNGIWKLNRNINDAKPIYLFLSHFHLDHIIGLHVLNKFNFAQGLTIIGQSGTRDILNKIINVPFTMPMHQLSYKTEIYEIPEEQILTPFKFTFLPLKHSSKCLGYRFEIEDKIISYCTDTGYCDNAVELARNADMLITECALKTGGSDTKWPHLNPKDAARIANEGSAKMLALVHFDACEYTTLDDRKRAEEEARQLFDKTFAAVDDMKIEI